MTPKNHSNNNSFNWSFWIPWFLATAMYLIILIFDLLHVNSTTGLTRVIILTVLLLIPIIKSVKIGNIFKLDLKEFDEIKEEVKEIRRTLFSINLQSNQTVNYYPQPVGLPYQKIQNIPISDRTKLLMDDAEQTYKQGKVHNSIEKYRIVLEEFDPNNWVAAFWLGYLYLLLEDSVEKESIKKVLDQSIFYSKYATTKNKTHAAQFINLAIAQKHFATLDGQKLYALIELALENLEFAEKLFERDDNSLSDPKMIIDYGKCLHFIAEFNEELGKKNNGIEYSEKAITVFKKHPDQINSEVQKWLNEAKKRLKHLSSG